MRKLSDRSQFRTTLESISMGLLKNRKSIKNKETEKLSQAKGAYEETITRYKVSSLVTLGHIKTLG